MNHPRRSEIANQVREIDPPARLRGSRGRRTPDGRLHSGSWIWRYDLAPETNSTEVRLTYDWSCAPAPALEVPPFGVEHLEISLRHYSVARRGLETGSALRRVNEVEMATSSILTEAVGTTRPHADPHPNVAGQRVHCVRVFRRPAGDIAWRWGVMPSLSVATPQGGETAPELTDLHARLGG